jgi:hypothetical protein
MGSLKNFLLMFTIISNLKLTYCKDDSPREPFDEYDREITNTNNTDLDTYVENGKCNIFR